MAKLSAQKFAVLLGVFVWKLILFSHLYHPRAIGKLNFIKYTNNNTLCVTIVLKNKLSF